MKSLWFSTKHTRLKTKVWRLFTYAHFKYSTSLCCNVKWMCKKCWWEWMKIWTEVEDFICLINLHFKQLEKLLECDTRWCIFHWAFNSVMQTFEKQPEYTRASSFLSSSREFFWTRFTNLPVWKFLLNVTLRKCRHWHVKWRSYWSMQNTVLSVSVLCLFCLNHVSKVRNLEFLSEGSFFQCKSPVWSK